MSFDKHYPNRKDIRKPYRGAKRFVQSCRNHGSCGYCVSNRTIKQRKAEERSKQDLQMEGYDGR